ncbi:MAG: cupin domain-containing protein, partial [Planctomycetes bacterium]|nr:cupin domain-containing protein [Planctomycetota bacterium]
MRHSRRSLSCPVGDNRTEENRPGPRRRPRRRSLRRSRTRTTRTIFEERSISMAEPSSTLNTSHLLARLADIKARKGPPPWVERLVWTDEIQGILICQAPGHPNDRHYHLHDEWWMVLEGEIEWAIEGEQERVRAKAGDFVLVPRNRFHHIHVTGDKPSIRLAIGVRGEPHRHE